MAGPTAESRILGLFEPGQTLTIEQVVERLPEIRWGRVFRAIKLLHERGELVVRRYGFRYEMTQARRAEWLRSAGRQDANPSGSGTGSGGRLRPAGGQLTIC